MTRRAAGAVLLALLCAGPVLAKGTGLVYVAAEQDNAVTLLDARTRAVVGAVPGCQRPRQLQRSADKATRMGVFQFENGNKVAWVRFENRDHGTPNHYDGGVS